MRRRFIKMRWGFSLIEVMLALAIVSIGMIAILGLLPSGLQSGRDAADNTMAATTVEYTFSALRASPFTQAPVCDACNPVLLGQPLIENLATYNSSAPAVGPVSNGYDYAGSPTSNNWASAYYKVILTYTPQSPTLTRVRAAVVWPAKSKATVITNIFVTEIAQHDQ